MAASLEEIGQALAAADKAGAADDARDLARLYQKTKGDLDMQRMANPTTGMSGADKFLSGAGKAFTDIGRGAQQLVSSDAPTMSGLITGDKRSQIQQDVDESRKRDAPLMKTGAGLAGNIVGNTAAIAPAMFIPGANSYAGAALIGAGAGALTPTATGESRPANMALGAGGGVVGQGVGNLLGRALKPIASKLSPEAEALAQQATHEGIPLTAGQRTGSRPLQTVESVMENLPLTSGPQLAGRETQQRAFTAAALRRAGIAGDAATPELLAGQKTALGGTMENIAKSNTLDFNQGLVGKLSQIETEALRRGETAAAPVRSVIDNILKEIGPTGSMEGKTYQAWRQTLRPLSGSGDNAHLYGQIRSALDSAFDSQMSASGQAAPWKEANRQYANLKTIMQAAGGPGAPAATNQIAPTQLSAALRQAMGKEGVALGRGDLNDLTRIGTTFVKEQIPNSGTAQRQMVQGLLTSGLGAGAGGGTAYAMGKDPMTGAGIGAGIGAGALLTPRLAQALMNSGAGQAYLSHGLVNLTAAERAMLANALRTGAIGGTAALEASR